MPAPKTPLLTVDAVIVYEETNIILIRRKNPPFQGELALPGGFADIGETVENACIREAKEETNLDIKLNKLIGVYSEPSRDPRGHTVSIAYLGEPLANSDKPNAQDDATSLEIVPIKNLSSLKLAFDHMQVIKDSGILQH